MITLFDAFGWARAQLHVNNDGGQILALLDNAGTTRLVYSLSADGSPSLILFDGNGDLLVDNSPTDSPVNFAPSMN